MPGFARASSKNNENYKFSIFRDFQSSAHCRLWTAGCGLPAVDCQLWTAGCGLPTADCQLWTSGCGLPAVDFRLWTAGCGLPAADFRLWTSGCGLPAVDCRLWTSGCGLPAVDCRLWTAGCGLPAVDCRLRTSGCGLIINTNYINKQSSKKMAVEPLILTIAQFRPFELQECQAFLFSCAYSMPVESGLPWQLLIRQETQNRQG